MTVKFYNLNKTKPRWQKVIISESVLWWIVRAVGSRQLLRSELTYLLILGSACI